MSTQITFGNTVLLGFIAGATISLGLLLGRMKAPAPRFRVLLNAIAIGILIFLAVDVLHGAVKPLEDAIDTHNHVLTLLRTVLLIGGLAVGILGLVGYDTWSKRRRAKLTEVSEENDWTPAARMSLLLAVGIGLTTLARVSLSVLQPTVVLYPSLPSWSLDLPFTTPPKASALSRRSPALTSGLLGNSSGSWPSLVVAPPRSAPLSAGRGPATP